MKKLIPEGMTRDDRRAMPIPFPFFEHERLLSKIKALENRWAKKNG